MDLLGEQPRMVNLHSSISTLGNGLQQHIKLHNEIQGVNLIEPVGTCLLITNETENNRYYLRAVTPNGPVLHYLPNINLRLKESTQETITTTAPLKSPVRYQNSTDQDDLLGQIQLLKMILYGLFSYTAILSLVILTYLLSKIRRRYEQDNADEPLVTTEESTPKTSNTNTPDSPVSIIPPPMPIIKHKRVDGLMQRMVGLSLKL